MNKNYFFTILASLTLPSLSNIQASLILRSVTAKFDSRQYLSIFCFADLSCTRHNQSKLCFCSRFGKVHSVTMHRISFADTAASRQSKQACSPLVFATPAHNQKSLENQFLEVTWIQLNLNSLSRIGTLGTVPFITFYYVRKRIP